MKMKLEDIQRASEAARLLGSFGKSSKTLASQVAAMSKTEQKDLRRACRTVDQFVRALQRKAEVELWSGD